MNVIQSTRRSLEVIWLILTVLLVLFLVFINDWNIWISNFEKKNAQNKILNHWQCTSIFEKEKLSEDLYYSWEAFIKYVAALGNARDTLTGNNVHWADYWDECKPCHFHYDYITHLDQEMFQIHFRSNISSFGRLKLGERMKIRQCFKKLGSMI